MKTLIISDTHLHRFDTKLFELLHTLISSVDKVIINGDLWEGWYTTFEEFVHSEWSKLFDLLLSKNTVYLFGNHDPKHLCDERTSLFSKEAHEEYDFTFLGKRYHCEHGKNILNRMDRGKLVNAFTKHSFDFPRSVHRVLSTARQFGYVIYPKLKYDYGFGRRGNDFLKSNSNNDCINIFSHTHIPEIDEDMKFVNTGSIGYNLASYVLLDEKGIRLEMQKY